MAFFLRRVGDRAEAEDLTQEVFARLAAHGDAEMRHADAYVFQMAANLLRDRGRRRQIRRDGFEEIALAQERGADAPGGERRLTGRERLAEVAAALCELSERTRAIFLLSRLEGLRHREIADMFAISVSAVQKHIVKAAAHLALRIGEEP
jgi:RNA polymerase sigma-70 factor (ECF subfamily)